MHNTQCVALCSREAIRAKLGAVELYFALSAPGALPAGLAHTDAPFYLRAAAHWANAYLPEAKDGGDTLSLGDVSALAGRQ